MSHTVVHASAHLTWNVGTVRVNFTSRDEHGETTDHGGVVAPIRLHETPALGEDVCALLEAAGQEMIRLAAVKRGSDGQPDD